MTTDPQRAKMNVATIEEDPAMASEGEKTLEYRVKCSTCGWESVVTMSSREAKRWGQIHDIATHGTVEK